MQYCNKMKDNLSLNHVKGHQDNEKDISELLIEAQLNVTADKLAGKVENHDLSLASLISGSIVTLNCKKEQLPQSRLET